MNSFIAQRDTSCFCNHVVTMFDEQLLLKYECVVYSASIYPPWWHCHV